MRVRSVGILVFCSVSILVQACSSSVEYLGVDAQPLVPRGDELCSFRKVALNEPSVTGTVTVGYARQLLNDAIVRSEVGLMLVDSSLDPDVVVDFIISDSTECVCCPEDHNYLSWSVIVSEAHDGRFVAAFARHGWKLTGNQEKAIADGFRSLKSDCAQPN